MSETQAIIKVASLAEAVKVESCIPEFSGSRLATESDRLAEVQSQISATDSR